MCQIFLGLSSRRRHVDKVIIHKKYGNNLIHLYSHTFINLSIDTGNYIPWWQLGTDLNDSTNNLPSYWMHQLFYKKPTLACQLPIYRNKWVRRVVMYKERNQQHNNNAGNTQQYFHWNNSARFKISNWGLWQIMEVSLKIWF